MHSAIKRRPSPWPRPSLVTSRIRSWAVSSSLRTQNTQPTRCPSISASHARSRVGVMISSEVGDDASNQRFEFGVPAEFCGVLLAMRHHNPTKIAGPICLPDDDGHVVRSRAPPCSLTSLTQLFQ